jgi:alkylhydroperoxidase family enzyme
MTSWIRMLQYEESTGYLRQLYDRVKGPAGSIDNVMKAHSLRPHTMEGHSALYKSVLHHTGNTTPVWFLECLAGLTRLLKDEARAKAIYEALAAGAPERAFEGRELALLRYVRKLTLAPQKMEEADVKACREAGCSDEDVFEANQVCAYFNYSNRLLNGLGVTTKGDLLGFSPPNTDKLDDWEHQ